MEASIKTELDFRPAREVFRRWLGRFLAVKSTNVEINSSVRTNQALALLGLVMVLAVLLGFGELARQKHHREAGKGTAMDGYFAKESTVEVICNGN